MFLCECKSTTLHNTTSRLLFICACCQNGSKPCVLNLLSVLQTAINIVIIIILKITLKLLFFHVITLVLPHDVCSYFAWEALSFPRVCICSVLAVHEGQTDVCCAQTPISCGFLDNLNLLRLKGTKQKFELLSAVTSSLSNEFQFFKVTSQK